VYNIIVVRRLALGTYTHCRKYGAVRVHDIIILHRSTVLYVFIINIK
jgi:hypothetical protein